MTEASDNNLSPEHQAIIDRLTGEDLNRKTTQARLDRAESIAFVRNAPGKEVIGFSSEKQARIREVLAPIYGQRIEAMSAQGIDGAAMLSFAVVSVN